MNVQGTGSWAGKACLHLLAWVFQSATVLSPPPWLKTPGWCLRRPPWLFAILSLESVCQNAQCPTPQLLGLVFSFYAMQYLFCSVYDHRW